MNCGLEVQEAKGVSTSWEWAIKGAVIGERIGLTGHKICLENLNNLVIPCSVADFSLESPLLFQYTTITPLT